jgi:hypothetical protein
MVGAWCAAERRGWNPERDSAGRTRSLAERGGLPATPAVPQPPSTNHRDKTQPPQPPTPLAEQK